MEEINEICGQCKREVPKSNMTIHLLRCVRNVECQVCDETVPAKLIDQHMVIHNKLVNCPYCQKEVAQKDLDNHKKTKCQERKVQCEYCEIDLRQPDMEEHKLYCGTRTEQCLECNEYVMFKYKQLHLDSNHKFLKLDDEPGPAASWDQEKATKPDKNRYDDVYKNSSSQFFKPGASVSKKYVDGGADFVFLKESNHRNENLFQKSHPNKTAEEIAERATTSLREISDALEKIRDSNGYRPPANYLPKPRTSVLETRRLANSRSLAIPTGAIKKGVHVRNKGVAPQPPKKEEEVVVLPCENCDESFPESKLMAHQVLCFPRFNYTNSFYGNHQEKSSLLANGLSKKKAALKDEIKLPCEFCCDLFPASTLTIHQNSCDVKDML